MNRLIITLLFGSIMTMSLVAQDNGSFRQRVKTLKKVKLVEYLDLEEDKADQLMLKFNSLEGQMEEATEELGEALEALESAVEENLSDDKLRSLNQDVKMKTENLLNIQKTKMDEIEKLLTTEEFAKFLVFEKNFREELRERISAAGRKREHRRGKRGER